MLEVIILIADLVLIAVLIGMALQLRTAFRQHKPPKYTSAIALETDLPSVTVCIPARNEGHALTDCLQRVLASTYERLEIIVLDDVSGDDTSALIKSFASEGVRFVKGAKLPAGWLGKNHALQGLLDEASGTYVLFLDVDTVLEPHAIEHMVRYAMSHRTAMLSVIPRREDGWRASVIASPLRYFWELIFSRRLWPASASNAWLIRRETFLARFQGFETLKMAVQPEAKIAAELAQTGDYRYLVGSKTFGVSYEKKWRSQLITSVRLLHPMLGSQVSLGIIAIFDLAAFLIPFLVVSFAFLGLGVSLPVFVLNVLLCLGFYALYGTYARRMWRRGWLLGALLWPFLIVQEMILIIASMYQYSRRTVKWKGRLIRPEAQN